MPNDKFLGFPYPIVTHARGYLSTQSGVEQIKSDLLALLLTGQGERPMLPNFGASLRRFLFEPNDTIVQQQIQTLITQQLRLWEPRVVIQDISLTIGSDSPQSLNPNDNLTEVDSILFVKISFFDPENIKSVQQLTLEVPLA